MKYIAQIFWEGNHVLDMKLIDMDDTRVLTGYIGIPANYTILNDVDKQFYSNGTSRCSQEVTTGSGSTAHAHF